LTVANSLASIWVLKGTPSQNDESFAQVRTCDAVVWPAARRSVSKLVTRRRGAEAATPSALLDSGSAVAVGGWVGATRADAPFVGRQWTPSPARISSGEPVVGPGRVGVGPGVPPALTVGAVVGVASAEDPATGGDDAGGVGANRLVRLGTDAGRARAWSF
jgi:hypothetical protein